MKTLVFDIKGDLGHFRKFYTTSSPLTFSFPPPPTVKGVLGAIYGAAKEDYLKLFSSDQCKIAIRIMSPIKKVRMGINLINTKDNFWQPIKKGRHEARTQIRTEFVKDPAYRIYFSHNNQNVFEQMAELVKNHEEYYTVSLGLSELIADISYVCTNDFLEFNAQKVDIMSVIPLSSIEDYGIDFEEGKRYFRELIPVDMNPERIVEHYEDVIFEMDGNSIRATMKRFWKNSNGDCIAFF